MTAVQISDIVADKNTTHILTRRFDAKPSIAIHNKYSLNYISTLIKLIHIS